MPRNKKKLTPFEKIKKAILTKISILSVFVAVISVVINIAFLQFNSASFESNADNSNITKWVKNNPQIIVQSVQDMQIEEMRKKQEEREEIAKEQIPAKMDELVSDSLDGSFSTKKPNINIIEFFDYNCGYCKRASETLSKLKSEKNIRIIYKEYPILGTSSEELSKVSIAVNIISPSKYSLFHHKLMKSQARTKDEAIKIAGKIGINVASLKSTLKKHNKKIETKIQKNKSLARDLGITGTPAFIIGTKLIPGAVGIEEIKTVIKEERSKK